jgi:adenylyltransferase/sulfurtransferase
LSGHREAVSKSLTVIDLWDNQMRQLNLERLRAAGGCPTCRGEEFPWLSGERGSRSAVLCGRNSVQLNHSSGSEADGQLSLDALAEKLTAVGSVTRNKYLLRCAIGNYMLTLFPDGRAIIGGTSDVAEARTVYAKYVGS